jgi:hypothetical protein
MATIPELLDGHVTLEVECLDRLYLNGYIGKLATGGGLCMFMRGQLQKPVPSPAVLGQISEKFRESVKTLAEREDVPIYQFNHKERKDETELPHGLLRYGLRLTDARWLNSLENGGLGLTPGEEKGRILRVIANMGRGYRY